MRGAAAQGRALRWAACLTQRLDDVVGLEAGALDQVLVHHVGRERRSPLRRQADTRAQTQVGRLRGG